MTSATKHLRKGNPFKMGFDNKHRIYIAVHARAYPWNQREDKGTAFYHYDILIEPKGAAEDDEIWVAYCGGGPTNTWRVHFEHTKLMELKEKLVLLVMIGKVPQQSWRDTKAVVLDSRYPTPDEDASSWIINVVTNLRERGHINKIDATQLMEFILKEADQLVVDKDKDVDEIVAELKVTDRLAREHEVDGALLEMGTMSSSNNSQQQAERLKKLEEMRKRVVPRLNFDKRLKFP